MTARGGTGINAEAVGIYAKGAGPCGIEEAQRRIADPEHAWFGRRLSRAKTYTALNAMIQGSAAQAHKTLDARMLREGIVPMLQMHDALDTSVTSREQGELIARLGERGREARSADARRREVRPQLG